MSWLSLSLNTLAIVLAFRFLCLHQSLGAWWGNQGSVLDVLCCHQWWVIRYSIAYRQESCCSLKISWYLVSKIYFLHPLIWKTRYLPFFSLQYLSRSPWFFESGKRWSYDHIESSSSDTWMWKVGFGNVISLKSSGGCQVLSFYIYTQKVILNGRLNSLGASSGSLLAWKSSLLSQGLGLAGRPTSLVTLARP